MKVERINEVQIKFILTKTDLEKRSLDITDLAYGSSKTQELFQDIVETASREFSFNVEDTPLMIEAVPMSKNSITIMLTKVSGDAKKLPPLAESLLKKIEALPKQRSENIAKREEVLKSNQPINQRTKDAKMTAKNKSFIFMFESLDEISDVARLVSNTLMESAIYKYKDEYMLILDSSKEEKTKILAVTRVINEHAKKVHGNSELVKAYLIENSEKIIAKNAISVMAKL